MRIQFLEEVQSSINETAYPLLRENLETYFKYTLSTNEFIAWLALCEEEVIATSGLTFYTVPPTFRNLTGRIGYIMNMYTLPDYRNKGIGTELFKRIAQEAIDLGCKKLSLHATEMGTRLYRKFGFEELNDPELVLIME
ncbi:MAG: GNAT family N-acetyltransferase [Spirochaetales bacterium]|nr:GNAT family N-acetyltransferase [Spirochaetales bacterium]